MEGYGSGAAQPTTIGGTVLPEAHEDQVQLGFRMIHNAYTSRVQHLENEMKNLKTGCEEQKSQAAGLQRKNGALEAELAESHGRQQKLSDENRELFKTVQNLRRQLQRLESLKRKVLDSISDEPGAGAVEDYQDYDTGYGGGGQSPWQASSAVPYGDGGPSSRGRSPVGTAGFGGDAGFGRGSSASVGGGRSASPPQAGGGGIIDGKQFFREARKQLSYEAFNDFLTSIKKLNNQQQSRDETLDEARRIFGPELDGLYRDFEQLLNRHAV